MEAFARAVQSGIPDSPTLRDAYQAMRVCEALLDSIQHGEPVAVTTD
jgi:predicted dehydrogenase